jgi:polyphosphate glucokinase
MKILVIDVGGTNLKVSRGGAAPVKIPSGPKMTAGRMAAAVTQSVEGWRYDAVAIGFPGPVAHGRPAREPVNLGPGWVRFDYERAFGKPVRIMNDAAMQALGSHQGGRMLFLGLGTGLGSAIVAHGVVEPLELAHLPYRKGRTYEDYVGLRGLVRLGRKRWQKHVERIVLLFTSALQVDYVVLGGGQIHELKGVPPGARLGRNENAIRGGLRLWNTSRPHAAGWAARKPSRRPRRMLHAVPRQRTKSA